MDRKHQRIPDNVIAIAVMALIQYFPELTPDRLNMALASLHTETTQAEQDRLVSAIDGAKLLGVSRRTFDRLSVARKISKVVITQPHLRADGREVGGSVRFRLSDVKAIIGGRA